MARTRRAATSARAAASSLVITWPLASLVEDADLVVVGGPTHVHGMRLETVPATAASSAAFDTRADVAPALVTGRASKGVAKQLHQHGFGQVVEPESFLVDKDNHLEPGEEARAEEWGARVAAALSSR